MSDVDRKLGDPMGRPEKEELVRAKEDTPVRRAGDTGLGQPEFDAAESRPLTKKEIVSHRKAAAEELRLEAEQLLAELEQEQGWKLPVPVRRFCTVVLVAVSAVLGLILITEVVQFMADINAMPGWSRWVAMGGLFLFGGILGALLLSLFVMIIRLHRSPRIHLQSMKVLAERRRLQQMAAEKQRTARTLLENYLRDYPLAGRNRKRLLAIGISAQDWEALLAGQSRLLDATVPLAAADWLDDFQRYFQAALDEAARRRVKHYATRVGVGTAVSPVPMVDRMIVFYGCISMVKDLFVIYHLRAAFGQTLVILARSLVHTYLSGVVEEATETAVDATADSLSDFVGDSAGVLTGTVGRAVGAKASEAALNGFLIWRLGKRAIALLQPTRN